MSVVAGFFLLGFIARLCRSDVSFPKELYQALTLFLLLAIGLKGGIALQDHANPALGPQSIAVVMLGLILPLIAFGLPAAAADFRALVGHGGPVMDVAIARDGGHALTASFDNSVGYWTIGSVCGGTQSSREDSD